MNNKIPPPIVTFICGIAIYFSKSFFNQFFIYSNNRISLFLLILGLVVFISAVKSFRRHKTTVNPLEPRQASSLVTSGIFKFSRNPIYLGMLTVLVGVAFLMSSLSAIIIAFVFGIIINFTWIAHEEKKLHELFSEDWENYSSKVRRWI